MIVTDIFTDTNITPNIKKGKNVTCYVRFQNEQGELVEPTHNGIEIKKEFIIKTQKKNVDIAD